MDWFNQIATASASGQQPAPPTGGWSSGVLGADPAEGMMSFMQVPDNVISDPSHMASVSVQAAASLPTDKATRAKYFAEQRGIPVSQYFYKDGRLGYVDKDKKAYFEEPEARLPTSVSALKENMKAMASGAGPLIPPAFAIPASVAAMSASALSGPPGWLTAVPTASVAGGTGDVVRQFLANRITGEEKPFSERAVQTGTEMLREGVGQLFGNAVVKGLNRFAPNALKTPTFNIPETTALREAAARFKIPLTAAEETGNRTLIRRQKILANTTQGEEPFTKFYEGRNEAVGSAVDGLINKLTRVKSPRLGSQSGVEGAQAAVGKAQSDLSAAARPAYEEAERGAVPLDQLTGGPAGGRIKIALDTVQRKRAYKDTVGSMPQDTIPVVDAAKKWIDDQVAAASASGRTNEARLWRDAADELRTIADANVPKYGEARAIFEAGAPARDDVTRGVTGDIAKLEGPDVLRARNIVFNPSSSSPEDIRMARAAFERAGKLQNWDDLAGAYLRGVFNSVPDSSVGSITNLGGAYRKAILGSRTKREMMEAAFEHNPQFWNEFQELMTVLDATGRAMKGESITAFAQAGQKELADEAKGLLPGVLESVEVWRTPGRVAQYWSNLRAGKYAQRQAELLTTPEGRDVLKELHRLGPTSAGAVITLSHFLTGGGFGAAAQALRPNRTGPVVSNDDGVPRPPPEILAAR